jgi:putative oxidoreductase
VQPATAALDLLLGERGGPSSARAALAVRLAAGAVFVGFSLGKFVRHEAERAALERYGIPLADQATYFVGAVELVGGLLLLAGLLTRLAAAALAVDMAVAISTAGRIEGGPVHLGLAPLLLAGMLFLLWAGAGPASTDRRLARRAAGGTTDPRTAPTP